MVGLNMKRFSLVILIYLLGSLDANSQDTGNDLYTNIGSCGGMGSTYDCGSSMGYISANFDLMMLTDIYKAKLCPPQRKDSLTVRLATLLNFGWKKSRAKK
jgi:hypothetical protein